MIKFEKNKCKNEKGITLIALVITIVILIILATVTLNVVLGEGGLIERARFAAFATKVRQYQEYVNMYVLEQQLAGASGDINITVMDKDKIKEIIPGISDEDAEKYVIQENEIRYNPDTVTDQEEIWLIQLGILAMTAMAAVFTVTYMVNGLVYQTVQGETITFPEIDPTSSTGNFAGWYYEQEGNREAVEGTQLTEDITLYAKWEYNITYMVNGEIHDRVQSSTIVFPEKEPMTDTQEFAGWYYEESCTNEAIEGTSITKNTILYAKMNELTKYTITFLDAYGNNDWVFDSIESGRALPTDKVPSDKYSWTCGCEEHNIRYVFTGWTYATRFDIPETENKEYKEGDIIDSDIQALASYKLDYGEIQGVVDGEYSYDQGSGYIPTDVPNPAPEKVAILNGTYKDEKIVSVEVENLHSAVEMTDYGFSARIIKWMAEDNIVNCDFLTIDNEGNLILTRQPNAGEGVIQSGNKYYLHFVTQITTETGRKERVLFNVSYSVTGNFYCLAEGTLVTLADRSRKAIEDITYEDKLLVWDFDNGCFAEAQPLWIKKRQVAEEYNLVKFDNGVELKTVADHRIFNMEAQKFTYTMNEEDTPIGTTTFMEDGTTAKLIAREVVKETVNYYNIITDYHMNLFANGILTSLRLNNLYKIENMKFVKDNRELVSREEFASIPDKYFYGLRLAEQPKEINRGNDVKHTNTLTEYVERIMKIEK